jgi:hypothetical protein
MIPRHASNRIFRPQPCPEVLNLDAELLAGSTEWLISASEDLETLADSKSVRAIDRRLEAINAELSEIRSHLAMIDRCLSRCVHRKFIFERLKSQLLNGPPASAFHAPVTSARTVSPRRKARFSRAAAALKGNSGRRRKYNRNGE